MKKIILLLFLAAVSLTSPAQCAMKNTAFKAGEQLSYNLYFNWKFVWYKVGKANMSVSNSRYDGKDAYLCKLTATSNGKLDKYFYMRDTLISYVTHQLEPLYFRKGAHEGKRYTVDEVWHKRSGSNNKIKIRRLHNDKSITTKEETHSDCIFDMLSTFLRARSFISSGWQRGHQTKLKVVSGSEVCPGIITYKGIETVKADNGKKYSCMKMEYLVYKKKKKKYERLGTIFITDDSHHIPVRIDFNLRFGSAKAFLTSMK